MFYIKIKPKRKHSVMGIYTNLCSLYNDFPVIWEWKIIEKGKTAILKSTFTYNRFITSQNFMKCKRAKKSSALIGSSLHSNKEADYIHKEIHPKNMTENVDGQF